MGKGERSPEDGNDRLKTLILYGALSTHTLSHGIKLSAKDRQEERKKEIKGSRWINGSHGIRSISECNVLVFFPVYR
jgi:hypothetical protein